MTDAVAASEGFELRARRRADNSSLACPEDRIGHAIARCNAELERSSAAHLQHGLNGAGRRYLLLGHRRRVLGDVEDPTVATDEDHVERDICVLHPEPDWLVGVEVEQHALPRWQALAIHE